MKNKGLLIGLGVVALLVIWVISTQRGLVSLEEGIKNKWGDVQNQYQRRADVFMNVVESVKGAAANEKEILTAVTNARAGIDAAKSKMGTATNPAELEQQLQMAKTAAMNFKITVEAYPTIRSTEAFLKLQDEIAGTENRVSKTREDYNATVKPYNTKIRSFPGSLIASMLGFKEKGYFEADPNAQKAQKIDLTPNSNTMPAANPSGSAPATK
jgi:LemA protein